VKTHNQGILVDITERKLAEDKLRKSEEKFRRIVETAGEGFILMNEDLVILDVNDAYCRMLGYAREEILGKTPLDLATEEFKQFMLTNKDIILAE
jgi:sigma-B regulation protein RsbU (phosphoserine phosphatase)